MPRMVLNDKVVVWIENNVERTPTMFAEEAAERISARIVNAVPPDAPQRIKEAVVAFRRDIHQIVFEVVEDTVRRAVNREKERVLRG